MCDGLTSFATKASKAKASKQRVSRCEKNQDRNLYSPGGGMVLKTSNDMKNKCKNRYVVSRFYIFLFGWKNQIFKREKYHENVFDTIF